MGPPASKALVKLQAGYKLGRQHTLRTSVPPEESRAGGMSGNSTPGAVPPELLSFFQEVLAWEQTIPVLSLERGWSSETLPETAAFSFRLQLPPVFFVFK